MATALRVEYVPTKLAISMCFLTLSQRSVEHSELTQLENFVWSARGRSLESRADSYGTYSTFKAMTDY